MTFIPTFLGEGHVKDLFPLKHACMFSFPDFLSAYLCAQGHVAQGQSFGMISIQSIESSNQVVNSPCTHTRLPETYFLMSFVNCTGV